MHFWNCAHNYVDVTLPQIGKSRCFFGRTVTLSLRLLLSLLELYAQVRAKITTLHTHSNTRWSVKHFRETSKTHVSPTKRFYNDLFARYTYIHIIQLILKSQ